MILEPRLHIGLQHHILLQAVIQHKTVLMTILRNMAHTGQASLADTAAGYLFSTKSDLSAACLLQTGQTMDQLSLSVSVDTGNADDFSLPDFKGDAFHCIILMQLGWNPQSFHLQNHILRLSRLFLYFQLNRTSHHHVGQFLFIGILRIDRSDIFPLPKNSNPIGYRHDFIQFMRDEQDGFAFLRKPSHNFHKFVDFLWRKNRCRFIKNQDIVISVQHLENFHSLLHANGNILYLGIHVHSQSISF